jgi:hypothetical protein
MKSIRVVVAALLFSVCAFAAPNAQQSFDQIKSLAGNWEGKGADGSAVAVSFKVMGNGSSVVSEINSHKHGDNMVSVFHMDKDRLLITHYCGAGNQPRMQATTSPDGKTITFDFIDGTNILPSQVGHMEKLIVNIADAQHHSEKWVLKTTDGKEMTENFELERKQ